MIVTGKLSSGTKSLLAVVQDKVEPSIISHGQNHGPRPSGWKRPFLETASANRSPIKQITKETVEFPEKDESQGELLIIYAGPSPNDFMERKVCDLPNVFIRGLQSLAGFGPSCHIPYIIACCPFEQGVHRNRVTPLVSILPSIWYQTDNASLSSYIYFSEDTRVTMVDLPIYIGSVPIDELDNFDEKLVASFKRIASDGIDMTRMSMVINRDERQVGWHNQVVTNH